MAHTGSKQSLGLVSHSDISQSPRFQLTPTLAAGQQAYNKPEEVCKDLITNLENGMHGLSKFIPTGSLDPNTRVVKVIDPQTGMARLEHQQIAANFKAESVKNERY